MGHVPGALNVGLGSAFATWDRATRPHGGGCVAAWWPRAPPHAPWTSPRRSPCTSSRSVWSVA